MKKHPITSFNIQWQSYGFESPSVARQQSKGETEAPSFFRGSIKAINAAVRKTAENCCIDLLPTTASGSIYPERASATQKHFMAIVKIKICSTEALRACLTKPPNNKIARVYCCTKYESKCSPFHINRIQSTFVILLTIAVSVSNSFERLALVLSGMLSKLFLSLGEILQKINRLKHFCTHIKGG